MNDKKTAERIEKLLRLAGPNSGTTEPEKLSALAEAAKLFSENDFVIHERPKKRGRAPKENTRPSPYSSPYSPPWTEPQPAWRPTPAPTPEWRYMRESPCDAICAIPDCGEQIWAGDPVRFKITNLGIEYIHADRSGSCAF